MDTMSRNADGSLSEYFARCSSTGVQSFSEATDYAVALRAVSETRIPLVSVFCRLANRYVFIDEEGHML